MEELERAKDGLLCAPCDTDARECLMFQVLGRRCGEADRRDGCSSAMYGIRIFFDALQEWGSKASGGMPAWPPATRRRRRDISFIYLS